MSLPDSALKHLLALQAQKAAFVPGGRGPENYRDHTYLGEFGPTSLYHSFTPIERAANTATNATLLSPHGNDLDNIGDPRLTLGETQARGLTTMEQPWQDRQRAKEWSISHDEPTLLDRLRAYLYGAK